jgi:hypothetical protein
MTETGTQGIHRLLEGIAAADRRIRELQEAQERAQAAAAAAAAEAKAPSEPETTAAHNDAKRHEEEAGQEPGEDGHAGKDDE